VDGSVARTAERNKVTEIMIVFGKVDMVSNQITRANGRTSAHAAAVAVALPDLAAYHSGEPDSIGLYRLAAAPSWAVWTPEPNVASMIGRWHNLLGTLSAAKDMVSENGRSSPNWLTARFALVPVAFYLLWLSLALLPFLFTFTAAKAVFVLEDLAWLAVKRLAALVAGDLHGISSNKKTLVGHESDCCRSNQDDQQGRKHNDTRAQQGAQIGCYLIASTGVV